MIKYRTEKIQIDDKIETSISCDVCKKEYFYDSSGICIRDDSMEIQEFFRFHQTGGYNSIFGDGASIEIDVCQHCMKEAFGSCIRVSKSEIDRMMESVSFEPVGCNNENCTKPITTEE